MHFCRPALKLTLTFWMKEFSQERYSELVPWSKAHDQYMDDILANYS